MKLVKLKDGSTLDIKVNMLTLKILGDMGIDIDKAQGDTGGQIKLVARMIYAILYSNGKRLTEDDALELVPLDDTDVFFDLIEGFKEEVEKFQKKTQDRLNLLKVTK